jgi:hypothetical protein
LQSSGCLGNGHLNKDRVSGRGPITLPLHSSKLSSNYLVTSIAYANVASLTAKYDDFCAFSNTYKPSIIMLTETWLTSKITDSLVSLGGYTLFRADRDGKKGGGVCVYIEDHTLADYLVVPLYVDTGGIDSLFLKISNCLCTFVLGCVYRPPSSCFDDDKILINYINHTTRKYDKIFVFGDFNMPDVRWPINGNRLHTPSSQLLVDLLTDSHLHQLVTQPTRYRSNQQPSVLDLVITSDDSSIANLEYLNPIGKSDHVTLMADLQLCHTPRARTVLFQRTIIDFEALNKRLTQIDWKSLLSDVSVSRNWDHFKTALSDAVSQSTSTSLLKKSSSKPWINGRILGQVRKKRSLWRAFKRSGSATHYEAHRAFSNHLSSVIREARLEYEKGIADDKDPKRLYKHIRTKLSGPVKTIHVKDDSGLVVDSNNGVADVFAETFSKVFITEPPLAASTLSGNCNPNCITDIIFSRDTVLEKF